jgi:phytoene/squalene synthetase
MMRLPPAQREAVIESRVALASLAEVVDATSMPAQTGTNIGEIAKAIEDKKTEEFERNYAARAQAIEKAAAAVGVRIA